MAKGKPTKPGVKPDPPGPEEVDPRHDMPSWGDEGGGGQYESGPTARGEESEDEDEDPPPQL